MLLGPTSQQLSLWKSSLYQYQKSKRTKKPFGPILPPVHHITEKQVKQQQTTFNPVLQTFKHSSDEQKIVEREEMQRAKSLNDQLRQQAKHEKPYDIINLYPYRDQLGMTQKTKLNQVPLRTNYNIVSNEPLPQYYYRNRAVKLTQKPEKISQKQDPRDYNIITNVYKLSDKQRKQQEWKDLQQKQQQKYWKTHDYNSINGKYYDANKQQLYQEQLEKQMKQHGKTQKYKLPASYLQRVPVVVDPSKEISEEARLVQQKIKNSKKRYETRYVVEKEYGDRNFEEYLRQEAVVKNRPHEKRREDEKKEFDIITLKENGSKKEQLARTWDRVTQGKSGYDEITFGKKGE